MNIKHNIKELKAQSSNQFQQSESHNMSSSYGVTILFVLLSIVLSVSNVVSYHDAYFWLTVVINAYMASRAVYKYGRISKVYSGLYSKEMQGVAVVMILGIFGIMAKIISGIDFITMTGVTFSMFILARGLIKSKRPMPSNFSITRQVQPW